MPRLSQNNFSGGISPESKSGLAYACRFSRNLNIYEDNNYVTLNPLPTKISSTTITDLIVDYAFGYPYTSLIYLYGDTGNLYSLDPSTDTVTLLRSVSASHGQGVEVLDDYLFYTRDEWMGIYGPLSGTPVFNDSFFQNADEVELDPGTGASNIVSGQTYSLTTSINEGATHRQTFIPSRDTLRYIELRITSKGTGDWTLTVHDQDEAVVGTKTVANASLGTGGGTQTFTFSSPLRMSLGRSYHFHITSTVADGTAQTGTASDLEDAQFRNVYGQLIDYDFHPIYRFTNGVRGTVVIGNANYIAEYDFITYNPNRIVLEPGYHVRTLFRDKEYIVAACTRSDNPEDSEYGMLFYWDGIQEYYNYAEPITMGAPNAFTNNKGRTFSVLGSTGDLFLGTDPFNHIQQAPKLTSGKKVEVYPQALENWQRRVYYGLSNSDDTTGIEQGIYEFGSASDRDTGDGAGEVLNHAYTMSTGTTQGSTIKYGAIIPRGKTMYFSWKDGATYGMDKVVRGGSTPASTGTWESLIIDVDGDGRPAPHKEKQGNRVVAECITLPAGGQLRVKYKINRGSWQYGTYATEGATRAEVLINSRYYEIEYGFDIIATTNYVTVKSVTLFFDGLNEETDER